MSAAETGFSIGADIKGNSYQDLLAKMRWGGTLIGTNLH